MTKPTWIITQRQIADLDIDAAILKIPEPEIASLAGAVRLRVEEVNRPTDIYLSPIARRFFRNLHKKWPWAAYFLQLHPVDQDSPTESIIDVSMFMSLAFCHIDSFTFAETPDGFALTYDRAHLHRHLAELRRYAIQLAEFLGTPPAEIAMRDQTICRAITSYFDLGRAINQTPNDDQNNKHENN